MEKEARCSNIFVLSFASCTAFQAQNQAILYTYTMSITHTFNKMKILKAAKITQNNSVSDVDGLG